MPKRLIAFYYWLTPLFWLADAAFGANLRAAALEGLPPWKTIYYLFCLACGVAIWKRPFWTGVIGMGEASVNILLLLLGIILPYFRIIDELAAGGAAIETSPLGVPSVIGLLLSGMVWVASFHFHGAVSRSGRTARRLS